MLAVASGAHGLQVVAPASARGRAPSTGEDRNSPTLVELVRLIHMNSLYKSVKNMMDFRTKRFDFLSSILVLSQQRKIERHNYLRHRKAIGFDF